MLSLVIVFNRISTQMCADQQQKQSFIRLSQQAEIVFICDFARLHLLHFVVQMSRFDLCKANFR